ncbi:MAG: DUF423 domain-containing protein [Ferruginibacter sp.]|nr:DUF423 domain-containing protein [Bacteroidota bacterium]MBX2919341.1 DUF423 domain-containing protein [Ferruginibacter sp.]MCB0709406.1 DUF423 domain-containing protein [Chitinophagaceae bacterium]MCC7377789.1 DUF423 domain-containing protein [Chitinophagaceae bacterium]
MQKSFLKTAALLGALSVMLGAFAAHGLKKIFDTDLLQVFETAVRYQFFHVFALLAAGILYKDFTNKLIRWAGYFFITGIILFCGSLYLLCYVKQQALPFNWIGAITPFGGAAFIAGWLCLFAGLNKAN